jgi:two-component system NtrC family sensor kinase
MRRREFITLLGVAAAWPLAAHAQQADRVRALLNRILRLQAENAAANIRQFIKEMESQVGWTTQLPWSATMIEQRRTDGQRLLRQVPAIMEIAQLDAAGIEQLRLSRPAMDVVGGKHDFSQDPKFTVAMEKKVSMANS